MQLNLKDKAHERGYQLPIRVQIPIGLTHSSG